MIVPGGLMPEKRGSAQAVPGDLELDAPRFCHIGLD
jgi:hypothetical protein